MATEEKEEKKTPEEVIEALYLRRLLAGGPRATL